MDDLKHIGKTEEKLQNQMQVVRTLHKCAKIELKKVPLIHSQNH